MIFYSGVVALLTAVFWFCGEESQALEEFYCPAGFAKYGKHCFIQKGRGPKAFAETMCRQLSSTLFEIHSWDDSRAIERFLKDEGIVLPVWLDGHVQVTAHRETTALFMWASKFFPSLMNFKTPPYKTLSNNIDCVTISPSQKYIWNQDLCSKDHVIVCSIPVKKMKNFEKPAKKPQPVVYLERKK